MINASARVRSGIIVMVRFFVIPLAGSFLIANGRFRFVERNPLDPEAVGLSLSEAEFSSPDFNRGLK